MHILYVLLVFSCMNRMERVQVCNAGNKSVMKKRIIIVNDSEIQFLNSSDRNSFSTTLQPGIGQAVSVHGTGELGLAKIMQVVSQ